MWQCFPLDFVVVRDVGDFILSLEISQIYNPLWWLFASEIDFENPHIFGHGVYIAGIFVFISKCALEKWLFI